MLLFDQLVFVLNQILQLQVRIEDLVILLLMGLLTFLFPLFLQELLLIILFL